MAAITTYPYVAYKATKSAMIAFTEQLAYQNAEYGIRANVILPGLMNTPMAVDTRAREWHRTRAEVEAERDSKVPLRKKMGTGWDVANAALFLASNARIATMVGTTIASMMKTELTRNGAVGRSHGPLWIEQNSIGKPLAVGESPRTKRSAKSDPATNAVV